MSIRLYFLCVILLITGSQLQAQLVSIATARQASPGAVVTVRGVVTNGEELGKIRYMQDGTAGIAAFPGNGSAPGFETAVKLGDSIEVSGPLVVFNELLEISPITAYSVISSNNTLPQAKPISLAQIDESLEGQLVRISCTNFANPGGLFSSAGTYDITDADGNDAVIYIRTANPITGTTIPLQPVELTAILSQFNEYQLLPRTTADFVAAPCFYFSEPPQQSAITTGSFALSWSNNLSAETTLRYGLSPDALNQTLLVPGNQLSNSATLSGLQAGAIYWVQAEAKHNNQTVLSEILPFATRSTSSGQIKVYFTRPIDESTAGGLSPNGDSGDEALAEVIARIDAAQQSIDVSMYNNGRTDILNALIAAHNRGVRVRYVAAASGGSPILNPPPPFPVIFGNDNALMHNKFVVIDAEMTNECWVLCGSLNWTDDNIFQDYNNALWIQDQSLARAFTLEFIEMWGADAAQPNVANSRFGSLKSDNTPHRFIVGPDNTPIELYFSPSDRTTRFIVQTIESADDEALFALLTFTRQEPAEAFVARAGSGVSVRGMIENTNDQGSEFMYLSDNGVNVAKHAYAGSLHHKYCVVDGGSSPVADPTVLTGSHNWSFSAETANDEHTLVIHSPAIALLYKAEFERRWTENLTPVRTPVQANVSVYPNPAQSRLFIQGPVKGRVSVLDSTGREWLYEIVHSQGLTILDISALPPGSYIAQIKTGNAITAVPFQKIQP